MTYNQELFKELDKTIISKVRIKNRAYIIVKGIGIMVIEDHIGLKLICDVSYVLEIDHNLLSVSQLLKKGYKVLFKDKNYMIKISNEMFRVQIKDESFTLNLIEKEQVIVHKEDGNTVLWYMRLAHFHHPTLLFIKKNNLMEDMSKLDKELPMYVTYHYEKQIRLPGLENYTEAALLNGSKYFITLIDDNKRMYWIYFIKLKYEVFDIF